MTRSELDKLVSIKIDLVRAMWLIDQLIALARDEHAKEDQVNASRETKGTGDDKQPI